MGPKGSHYWGSLKIPLGVQKSKLPFTTGRRMERILPNHVSFDSISRFKNRNWTTSNGDLKRNHLSKKGTVVHN